MCVLYACSLARAGVLYSCALLDVIAQWASLLQDEVQAHAASLGLDDQGLKPELIDRIIEAYKQADSPVSSSHPSACGCSRPDLTTAVCVSIRLAPQNADNFCTDASCSMHSGHL